MSQDDKKNEITKRPGEQLVRPSGTGSSLASRGLALLNQGKIKGIENAPPSPSPVHGVGDTKTIILPGGVEMEFCNIPVGEFIMGSEQADADRWTGDVFAKFNLKVDFSFERPSRKVTIGRPFYMGRYEVTQRQWRYVAEKLPKVKRDLDASPSFFKGDDLPVERVSWEDCEEYILRLNRLGDGFEYALPTEAEWEYACRAGTTGDYAADLDAMGWYANNSGRSLIDAYQAFYGDANQDYGKYYENAVKPNGCQTHQVGQKRPNAFGLYDMHGNVFEWCADWYDEKYYTNGGAVDPTGPSTGDKRVVRGGSWGVYANCCRSAYRSGYAPTRRYFSVGFRVVVHSSRT
jgi:formylglycine-generating enzyme required for sulfatase activity